MTRLLIEVREALITGETMQFDGLHTEISTDKIALVGMLLRAINDNPELLAILSSCIVIHYDRQGKLFDWLHQVKTGMKIINEIFPEPPKNNEPG